MEVDIERGVLALVLFRVRALLIGLMMSFFAQLDMIPLPLGVLLSNHENCTVHQSSLCHDGLVCQGNADVCATYLQITVKENR